jgi:gluconolactonase
VRAVRSRGMPTPQIDDPRFEALLKPEATLERLWTGAVWSEGPVYLPQEQAVVWSDIPNDRMLRWSADRGGEVWRAPSEYVNGNVLDLEGRIVHCSHGARALQRTEPDGSVTTLVDAWEGKRLNSPNDVVVRSDGTIWFTDPAYGHLQGFRPGPQLGDYVYRHDPATGATTVVADGFDKPNGLAFSPDERTLYVGDSGANQAPGTSFPGRPHHVEAFDVVDGRRLCGRRLVAVVHPGIPDGLKADAAGRLYVSCADGVQVHAPGGELLGEFHLPGAVNFAWGGPDRNVLFITADTAIWAAVLLAAGPPPAQEARAPWS